MKKIHNMVKLNNWYLFLEYPKKTPDDIFKDVSKLAPVLCIAGQLLNDENKDTWTNVTFKGIASITKISSDVVTGVSNSGMAFILEEPEKSFAQWTPDAKTKLLKLFNNSSI